MKPLIISNMPPDLKARIKIVLYADLAYHLKSKTEERHLKGLREAIKAIDRGDREISFSLLQAILIRLDTTDESLLRHLVEQNKKTGVFLELGD